MGCEMNKQPDMLLEITEGLCQGYNYAFSAMPVYHFIVPQQTRTIAVRINQKIYHCLDCNETLEVDLKDGGVDGLVFPDRTRMIEQQEIHTKYGLPFPEIVEGMKINYRTSGYCPKCFAVWAAQASDQPGQAVYNLCSLLMEIDRQVMPNAVGVMKQELLAWLTAKEPTWQQERPDSVCLQEQLRQFLGASQRLADVLAQYDTVSRHLIQEIEELLAVIPSEHFSAYVGRLVNHFESLCDSYYNEYTMIVPVEQTPDEYYFVQTALTKTRVEVFLRLRRSINVAELVRESGIIDEWVGCG